MLTDEQKKVVTETYNDFLQDFNKKAIEWREAFLQVLGEHIDKIKEHEIDLEDFTNESFLHEMKRYHTTNYDAEAAVQEAKRILNDKMEM